MCEAESRRDELGTAFVSCLRSLEAILKTKVAPQFDLGTEIENILALAKKAGPPSAELARYRE